MAGRHVAASAVLLGVTSFAYYSLNVASSRNGLFPAIADLMNQEGAPLPGFGQPGKTTFTRIPPVDWVLSLLLRFFYPCFSGESPSLSLLTAYFFGQILPMHSVLILESLRLGNERTTLTFPTVWGIVYQIFGAACVLPIYFATYLWKSPLVNIPPAVPAIDKAELLTVDINKLEMVRASLAIGFVFPSLFMFLGPPNFFSLSEQQNIIIFWQLFPVWVGLASTILGHLATTVGVNPAAMHPTVQDKIRCVREFYRDCLIAAGVVHGLSLAHMIYPRLLTIWFTLPNYQTITLKSVFVPASVASSEPIQTVAEGTRHFLQWDLACICLAGVFWVSYMSYTSSGNNWQKCARTTGMTLVRSLAVGPLGAVLWAFWDRDEEALQAVCNEEKKK